MLPGHDPPVNRHRVSLHVLPQLRQLRLATAPRRCLSRACDPKKQYRSSRIILLSSCCLRLQCPSVGLRLKSSNTKFTSLVLLLTRKIGNVRSFGVSRYRSTASVFKMLGVIALSVVAPTRIACNLHPRTRVSYLNRWEPPKKKAHPKI